MIYKLFSVRDSKSEIFHSPWFFKTHGEAEREFRTVVNTEKSKLAQFPEDYDLYYVGEYDDNTGKFNPVDSPQHVIKAVNCVQTQQ